MDTANGLTQAERTELNALAHRDRVFYLIPSERARLAELEAKFKAFLRANPLPPLPPVK